MVVVTKKSMKNVVLFYIYKPLEITGSTINAIEYFLAIYEHNPDIKLVLVNGDEMVRDMFINLAESRYDIDDLDYKDSIICLSKIKLIRNTFDKALVLDFETIKETRELFRANEIIVIQEKHTEKEEYRFDKINSKNITLYGEMPFQKKDVQYRMKMLFHRFKSLRTVKPAIYVNSPRNKDYSFLKKLDLPNKPIIYKTRNHLDNMFEQFDTYLYYHADTWFDPHPRLFHECLFYCKEIIYKAGTKRLDGSYYRYIDMSAKGLQGRILGRNDEIVRRFL